MAALRYGVSMWRGVPSLPPEGVKGLFEALVDAREDRGIAQGVAAPLGFAQGHDQVQEVFRLVAFEGHDPFLVIQSEGVRRVELHRREPVPTSMCSSIIPCRAALVRRNQPR